MVKRKKASHLGANGKEPACQSRRSRNVGSIPGWVRKIPWRRALHPTPVFLPGKLPGQRSLAGYSLCRLQRVGHSWTCECVLEHTKKRKCMFTTCERHSHNAGIMQTRHHGLVALFLVQGHIWRPGWRAECVQSSYFNHQQTEQPCW